MSTIKLAIVRSSHAPLNTKAYNVQEIGLALGLLNQNISTDIYSRFSDISEPTVLKTSALAVVRLIPVKGITLLRRITWFPGLIKQLKNNYNIIQVHEDSQLMTALILRAAVKNNIKTVLYQGMYNNYSGLNRLYQIVFDFLFKKSIIKNSTIVFAKTDIARQYLLKKGHKKVEVLPVGLEIITNEVPLANYNELNGFKNKFEYILLYVGKLEKRRNPLFLIDVLEKVRFMGINAGLVIIGDGPLKTHTLRYLEQKEIGQFVYHIQSVPNNQMHEVYRNADLFLLPTNHEIYGMVVMEAMYYGLPVVATPEAGPLSILKNNDFGICLNLDEEIWAKEVAEYLLSKNNNIQRIARTDFIRFEFDWKTISISYLTTVKTL